MDITVLNVLENITKDGKKTMNSLLRTDFAEYVAKKNIFLVQLIVKIVHNVPMFTTESDMKEIPSM